MNYEDLMTKAKDVSQNAYAPYSKFQVGACLLTTDGNIYTGCNFENSSYGLSICAERNAVGSAIANGEKRFKAIAIYSPNQDHCVPCGACRQVLHEFCDKDDELDVILQKNGELKIYTLKHLLPESFSL